ncbi:NAD(P)-dependent oxidoreductase [Halobacillus fulvus]|nr:NAD(P)-dependent oxidoreductase [Halobacillus fulvus]
MNIIVFGATGKTGTPFVKQALDHGHRVTAFVRSPEKLVLKHENLQVFRGDALKEDHVVKAIEGHDVVVSCLGSEGLKPSRVLEYMAENIVTGMQKHGLSRIAYVASAGLYNEIPGFLGWMSQRILKNVLEDHRRAVNTIIAANLDYTIARPLRLEDGLLTEEYRMTPAGVPDSGSRISRNDVAHFLLRSIEEDEWIKETVGLAY